MMQELYAKGNNKLMKRNMDRFLSINYSNYRSTFRSGGLQ